MLTESERQWLSFKPRKARWKTWKFCQLWCVRDDCCIGRCPLEPSWPKAEDAAEFSERVAAKIAEAFMGIIDAEYDYQIPSNCAACPCKGNCSLDCKASILKWARLAVEEEMDGSR